MWNIYARNRLHAYIGANRANCIKSEGVVWSYGTSDVMKKERNNMVYQVTLDDM